MRDLPKICQPLQCSNFLYDHSHMKNEIKPMEIFDISTIMQCLGEKKKLQKFSFPFQSEFRKTISSFF